MFSSLATKEFFAEMSVAFLSRAYHSLNEKNKFVMEDCSPPLIEPNTTDRVLSAAAIATKETEDGTVNDSDQRVCWFPYHDSQQQSFRQKNRLVDPLFQEAAIHRNCLDVQHCNKFYPFTQGQLKYHDESVFVSMKGLWQEIALWDDPYDDRVCFKSMKWFWNMFV